MTRVLALALMLLASAAAAQADAFRTYRNARFGVTAEVPADWRPGREPENGDGLQFTAPDGRASLTVSGGLHIWDTVDEAMAVAEDPRGDEKVTYRHRGPRSLVVSGTRGERIFYRKSLLTCRDRIWNNIEIEYPAARKREYDALVARVARSLRGGRSAQVPGCG